MTRSTFALAAALPLLITSLACAQPSPAPAPRDSVFLGEWDLLDGRYSNRRNTEGTLRVERHGATGLKVSRTAWFTSRRYRSLPPFTWESTAVLEGPSTLYVLFRVPQATAGGAVGALSSPPSPADPVNVFVGTYEVSPDGFSIEERVVNVTRRGTESWWRHITSFGYRSLVPASSLAPFVRAAQSERDHLAQMMMYLRVDFSVFGADYNGPGGMARYQADEQALGDYFDAATFEEVSSYPADWTTFKVLRAVNPVDPRGVVLPGEVYLMLDAQASVIQVVCKRGAHYYTEGGDRLPW